MTTKGTFPPIFANDTTRRIVHVDMDAFYASVEQRDRPELRGRPIAVGHEDGRGVVATASYEARRFGVRSAMPSRRARELCPELIFVPSRIAYYREVSAQIHDIFHRYTDVVEPLSLDEAFLDVTGNKLGLEVGTEVARRIKEDIRRELNLIASAGVSYNKFLAKIASDFRKPDGLCTIHPSRAIAFIDRLPVEALWGVGPATARPRLLRCGRSRSRFSRTFSDRRASCFTSSCAASTIVRFWPSASERASGAKRRSKPTSARPKRFERSFRPWPKSSRAACERPRSAVVR